MRLQTVAPHFLVLSSVLVFGCCPELFRDSGFEPGTSSATPVPVVGDAEPECDLCAALGLDFKSDAALVGVGFVADGLLPSGFGAEADIEVGQGSEDDSGSDYNPGDYLGKTAGFGSDYTVTRGSLHARYPIPMGDNSEMTFVPLAGLGLYHWSEKDCQDPLDQGFCSDTETVLEVGGEVEWRRFGVKLWVPLSNKTPDVSLRLRYHLPIGAD